MEGQGLCGDPAPTQAHALACVFVHVHTHTHTGCTPQQVYLPLTSVFPNRCVIPSPPNLPAQ